jgi:DNA modification methylase
MTQHKTVKLTDFTPDPNNANKGTQRGRGLLENSLQKLGAGRSVLADKNGVLIAGNKTLQTAVESGFENAIVVETDGTQLVVVKRTDLDLSTDAKAKELAVADNRIGEISLEWDADVLSALSEEFDLSSMFFEEELEGLWKEWASPDQGLPLSPEEEEENASDLIEKAESGKIESRVKLGEIWSLGRHRLCCGDSTVEGNVKKLLGDVVVDLLFTSPPYSDMRDYKDGTDISVDKIAGFIPAWHKYVDLMAVNLGLKFKDGEVISYWDHYTSIAKSVGLKMLAWNVWDKKEAGSIASATNMFHLTHEWIFVFGRKRKVLNRTIPNQMDKYMRREGSNLLEEGFTRKVRGKDGDIFETTSCAYTHHQLHSVVSVTPEKGSVRSMHPAIYPTDLPTQYFDALTNEESSISDPFLGSGTTIIAAQQMEGSRRVFGFELSPDYCEVILRRYESLTGDVAELVGHL